MSSVTPASSASSTNSVPVVDPSQQGFSGLNSDDFLKLLVTQLQNQDPTNPMDSDQLLNQISQMRTLQSGIELDSAIKGLTTSQQLTGAASLLGKTVSALHGTDQQEVDGVVDRVQVKDGKATLTIDGTDVDLSEVVSVAA